MQGSKENGIISGGSGSLLPPEKMEGSGNYFAAEKCMACTVCLPSDLAIYTEQNVMSM